MPEIVQERRSERVVGCLLVHAHVDRQIAVTLADARDQPRHHVRGPDRVRETRVLAARIDERREPELPHAA